MKNQELIARAHRVLNQYQKEVLDNPNAYNLAEDDIEDYKEVITDHRRRIDYEDGMAEAFFSQKGEIDDDFSLFLEPEDFDKLVERAFRSQT